MHSIAEEKPQTALPEQPHPQAIRLRNNNLKYDNQISVATKSGT